MIGYVTLGSNDIPRAATFYDGVLGILGAKRAMDFETYVAWSTGGPDQTMVSIITPYNKEEATVGNGVMVALAAESNEQVDALHAKALELGGADEGAPGPRGAGGSGFYIGYFRDLDGNKLAAFHVSRD